MIYLLCTIAAGLASETFAKSEGADESCNYMCKLAFTMLANLRNTEALHPNPQKCLVK